MHPRQPARAPWRPAVLALALALAVASAAGVLAAERLVTGRVRAPELAGAAATGALVLLRHLWLVSRNRDLAARLAAREHDLAFQARHDPLTGLGNRADLVRRIQEHLAAPPGTARPLALLFCDLDDFKAVNDTLGHRAGDELLEHVAFRISGRVRAGDAVARLGGDEFAVLLQRPPDEAERVAHELWESLQEPFPVRGHQLSLGASIGLVHLPTTGRTSAGELLRSADLAMYEAKRRGKNAVRVFTRDLRPTSSAELTLRADLLTALDRGEVGIVYQPLARADDGRVVAVEALARWTHPSLGPLAPLDFVAVAERAHLTHRLTDTVLAAACAALRDWRRAGEAGDLELCVNVSADELTRTRLPERIEGALAATGLPGALLTVEVTETALMDDVESAARVLARIRALGCAIAIDDFGTGYSSLARLGSLPVDSLKIDKSFVVNLGEPRRRDLVAAIIGLAHSQGLTTVAEGVETRAQWDLLRELGCDLVQGYCLGRPTPRDGVPALLRQAGSPASA